MAFEYELPLEGGRRPDVVVLAGETVVVLEFKQYGLPRAASIDQVRAYARDLQEYHEATHYRRVEAVLVLTGAATPFDGEGLDIVDPKSLADALLKHSQQGSINLKAWLESPYAPLPSLIDAARHVFRHEPLPAIRRHASSRVPRALELLAGLAEDAMHNRRRVLTLVAGVPGAGKTLAGLSLVYNRLDNDLAALLLSGNGPLVKVLKDALGTNAVVKDLHGYVNRYGRTQAIPREHVVVFDEAQRAWDAQKMLAEGRGERSEPDLLIQVGERLPDWAVLVGLIGDGQEIHGGEEGGIGQWREALQKHKAEDWEIHCPPASPLNSRACMLRPMRTSISW